MVLALFTKSMAVLFMGLSLKFYQLPNKQNHGTSLCVGGDIIIKANGDGGEEKELENLTSTF